MLSATQEHISALPCKQSESMLVKCRGSSALVPSPRPGSLVILGISRSRSGRHSTWSGPLAHHHWLPGRLQQPFGKHRVCHQQCHCEDLCSNAPGELSAACASLSMRAAVKIHLSCNSAAHLFVIQQLQKVSAWSPLMIRLMISHCCHSVVSS